MARFPQTLVITENSAQSGNATIYPAQLHHHDGTGELKRYETTE